LLAASSSFVSLAIDRAVSDFRQFPSAPQSFFYISGCACFASLADFYLIKLGEQRKNIINSISPCLAVWQSEIRLLQHARSQ